MFTLAIVNPPAAIHCFRQLQERINASKHIYTSLKFDMPPLMTDSLQDLLTLEVSNQQGVRTRPIHTLQNCAQYPELGAVEDYHGNSYHRDCLSVYLTDQRLRYPNLPLCPMPDCQQKLPATVLSTQKLVSTTMLIFTHVIKTPLWYAKFAISRYPRSASWNMAVRYALCVPIVAILLLECARCVSVI